MEIDFEIARAETVRSTRNAGQKREHVIEEGDGPVRDLALPEPSMEGRGDICLAGLAAMAAVRPAVIRSVFVVFGLHLAGDGDDAGPRTKNQPRTMARAPGVWSL